MHVFRPMPGSMFEDQVFFRLGEVDYLGLPVAELLPASHLVSSPPSLISIVHLPSTQDRRIKPDWLLRRARAWLNTDDTFRGEFLDLIIVVVDDSHDKNDFDFASTSFRRLPREWTRAWDLLSITDVNSQLYEGAHVISGRMLYRPFRIHNDIGGAFMMAIKPRVTKSKPLYGVRFAVKDVFRINGLRVTAGNRAYYAVSKPATATSASIQRLIDAGAELLGTLKLGSLIAREEPTESVDFHAPFNPRGDGYQSAWSSSGGSGAAIAAYDWLDFTIGTDTTGSSRRPAMANGVFQIRLTHNAIPIDDVVPSFPRFDSIAMYTRDILSMEKWVQVWLGNDQAASSDLPINIVYLSDFLPIANRGQMDLIDKFFDDLETAFDVKTQKMSIADTWAANTPADAGNLSVQEYLKDVGLNTFVYDVYHTMDGFRKEYHSQYSRQPYVNPVTRYRWGLAKNISKEEHDEAMKRLDVYKDWLLKYILREKTHDSLVILPITGQEVDYREDPPE
ncbi:amidase signature domain-containing protein [Nemania abortiva]|nr:amidase signature domain-containing protein [Nemania abortiva]